MDELIIRGAREHNLKNIDLILPRNRFIVFSGVSGSGKSSLAFDTIYAEGQRRYVESLSAYARQFLGQMEKPDLDDISGLSPAIAIEQKSSQRNPRSTVGTVTEVHDYLRLLYARVGQAYCPKCNILIQEQSIDQIIANIFQLPENQPIYIFAPILKQRKTEGEKIFEDARAHGFARIRINGTLYNLEENLPKLDKRRKYDIEILIDRLRLRHNTRQRLSESLETAIELSQGQVLIVPVKLGKEDDQPAAEQLYSEHNSCEKCGFSVGELEPRLFSFNSPLGACADCGGLGYKNEFSKELLCPNPHLSLRQGAIEPYRYDRQVAKELLDKLAQQFHFSLDTPFNELDESIQQLIWEGPPSSAKVITKRKGTFQGVLTQLQLLYRTREISIRKWLAKYMREKPCPSCLAQRLNEGALSVRVGGVNIWQVSQLSIFEAREFFRTLELEGSSRQIAGQILKEIRDRLGFLCSVGLEYLNLNRAARSLSGGEAQRIRLATQIGSALTGVLYVLDEPSIGLHQRDNEKLIATLLKLRDLGNTVIVVEHDEQTLQTADHIVDIGPAAGVHGGEIVAQGSPDQVASVKESLTGQFLSGNLRIEVPNRRREGNGHFLSLKNATEHNLKGISLELPLGCFVLITGVSGSGKSTLLRDIIYPAVQNRIGKSQAMPEGCYTHFDGWQHLQRVIEINQSPIGRTPRSNPATYVGLFTPIRNLFAELPEAKARGFKAGRFSFNVRGGRCENCEGGGLKKIEMHFLPDVYVVCDICQGKRFNRETLEVRYKGYNIHQILEMTVEEALHVFAPINSIAHKLSILQKVGLGYIRLGQSALTLSGGEAQRVKLALELSRRTSEDTLYIIDEPTTGLHQADIKQLLLMLHTLVDRGSSIFMIEHNLDVIKQADYIVDLGPEGGDAGGQLMAQGTPEQISKVKKSYTGAYLKPLLSKKKRSISPS